MTWKWGIEGKGTVEQTCIVKNDAGDVVDTKTQEGWSWPSDEYPEFVETTVGNHDFQALYMDDIERFDPDAN